MQSAALGSPLGIAPEVAWRMKEEEEIYYIHAASTGL